MIELIGYIAACLTTFSFLPQAIKTLKTKDTSALSLGMYSIFSGGVFLWLLYGLLISNWPIVAANFVTLLFSTTILTMKLRNHGKGLE